MQLNHIKNKIMKKNIINEEINTPFSLDWEGLHSLGEIKKDIKKLEYLGVTHIDISEYNSYGDTYIIFSAFIRREETDEEAKQRIILEENKKLLLEEKKFKLYQLLKEKFQNRNIDNQTK